MPGVLSWRRRRDAAREASGEAARENPPAAFLMSFECCPFLSARLELFDYPARKSGVIDTDWTRKRARPSVTIKSRTETTTCCKLFRTQAGY